ncbi:PREDICTED: uncharacterized protein LOC104745515 isoform X1 [Camelina sativa]|uniref:Uncharacterized protein LOC104745515 isoform X1 n=1 Tax=Camelina sativa TaxID=90675 RepID=A0ABM0W396_CAMSA|nr:PREDICTED: uncharacterized protein LOC104745515 isoform X1 [Camelina sativa]
MAGNGMPTLGRVKVCDLAPSEGLPSDSYKLAVTTLSQSLAQYSAAIIQFPTSDGALLRSGLDSARLYFHQRDSYPAANNNMIHTNDSSDWCKTSGYYADPQSWQESYEYRPGLSPTEPTNSMEFPPSGLPDIFALLGKAARVVLDAIGYYLNLRSCPFTEILDNVPLRNNEISSSVLSVCCYARPSFHGAQHHNLTEDEQLILYSDHDHQLDKSLISFVKSDKAGLHIRDMHGQWILVDMDLGPQEAVVYPGLALYQATAGYVSPAVHRTDLNSMQGSIEGRFSLAFKLMPKSMTNLSCSEMRAAGHGVEAQFQLPVSVDDFMQRPHSNDELFNRQTLQSFSVPQSQDGSMKQMKKRRKSDSRCKPLPPSKRLRLEAQRVLKERVQEIADKKGIKLRFCNLKECENNHNVMNSPCANIKREIGWPHGVPFVHPHDLPNKAKIGFLETYEPGWSETHDMELSLSETAQGNQHVTNCNHSFTQ